MAPSCSSFYNALDSLLLRLPTSQQINKGLLLLISRLALLSHDCISAWEEKAYLMAQALNLKLSAYQSLLCILVQATDLIENIIWIS